MTNCDAYYSSIYTNRSSWEWKCANEASGCIGQGDGDIAGLGVLLAFMITAYINVSIAWISYLFNDRQSQTDSKLDIHVLDKHFLAWFWSVAFLWSPRSHNPKLTELWRRVMERVTLIMSDQFLVTGVAVLATGYIKSGSMSIYHFEIVAWLGWLASNGHQISLTSLRSYLGKHQLVLWCRIGAMGFMWVLLIVAISLAGASSAFSVLGDKYTDTVYPLDTPARCTWSSVAFVNPSADTVFATCVLVLGFLSRVIRLFDTSSNFFESWMRIRPRRILQSLGQSGLRRAKQSASPLTRIWWKLATGAVITIYIFGKVAYDCVGSMLNQLLWLTLSLLYGTFKIFAWRSTTSYAPGLIESENQWGFGQIVPLLMLIIPLITLPELVSEEEGEEEAKNSDTLSTVPPRHTSAAFSPQMKPTAAFYMGASSPELPRNDKSSPSDYTDQAGLQSASAQNHRILLPWQHDIHKSRWFRLLVALVMLYIIGIFLTLVVISSFDDTQAGDLLLDPEAFGVFLLPAIAGAVFFWWMFAIFLSSIWGAVRDVR